MQFHLKWVCVRQEGSVSPEQHPCFHLQVNVNNTFCHQGMFVMSGRWRGFSAAAAALLRTTAGQRFTTCHYSLPEWHCAMNLQSGCCPLKCNSSFTKHRCPPPQCHRSARLTGSTREETCGFDDEYCHFLTCNDWVWLITFNTGRTIIFLEHSHSH